MLQVLLAALLVLAAVAATIVLELQGTDAVAVLTAALTVAGVLARKR